LVGKCSELVWLVLPGPQENPVEPADGELNMQKMTLWKRMRLWMIALGVVGSIWAPAVWIAFHTQLPKDAKPWDIATLLFAASTFAVFAFSILLAILAVVGWQTISENIRRQVKKAFKIKKRKYNKEIIGRHFSVMAFLVGYSSYDHKTLAVTDYDLLNQAIDYGQIAARKFPKKQDHSFYIANNLVSFLCLRGERGDKEQVLREAERLMKKAQPSGWNFMVLTACRAMCQYADDPQAREAKKILEELSTSAISADDRREAKLHLAWLRTHRPTV
jgi:hypothetical protein